MSLSPGYTKNIKIVFIYSSSGRQDENLRQDLEKHLSTLKHSGVFMEWCKYPLDISHFSDDTNNHTFNILNTSDVVALLVNPQLISLIQNTISFYTEIQHILQRGKQEEIIVVPLLIRELHGWEKVLGDLNPLNLIIRINKNHLRLVTRSVMRSHPKLQTRSLSINFSISLIKSANN